VKQARTLLAGWQAQVNEARHRIGKTVALGTTEFTLRFVGIVWQRVAEEFAAREIELNVVHLLWQAFASEVASGNPYQL
jgi:hypothetical protein